jgi:hypothetical protein
MNADEIQIISTAIVSVATLAYAVLTLIIVKETIELRKAQTEPEIIVYFQPKIDKPFFYEIVVKNIGGSTAYNLKWSFDPIETIIKDQFSSIGNQNFFSKGVAYFAPGQFYNSFFGSGVDLSKKQKSFDISVTFTNRQNKKYFRTFTIDTRQYLGRSWIGNEGVDEIAENLKKIERHMDHIISGFDTVKVDVFSSNDRKIEQENLKKQFQNQEKARKEKNSIRNETTK